MKDRKDGFRGKGSCKPRLMTCIIEGGTRIVEGESPVPESRPLTPMCTPRYMHAWPHNNCFLFQRWHVSSIHLIETELKSLDLFWASNLLSRGSRQQHRAAVPGNNHRGNSGHHSVQCWWAVLFSMLLDGVPGLRWIVLDSGFLIRERIKSPRILQSSEDI